MDIFQAGISGVIGNDATLVDLKAMNKKFAFSVGQKGPKKMEPGMGFKYSNVMVAIDNF